MPVQTWLAIFVRVVDPARVRTSCGIPFQLFATLNPASLTFVLSLRSGPPSNSVSRFEAQPTREDFRASRGMGRSSRARQQGVADMSLERVSRARALHHHS